MLKMRALKDSMEVLSTIFSPGFASLTEISPEMTSSYLQNRLGCVRHSASLASGSLLKGSLDSMIKVSLMETPDKEARRWAAAG